MSDAETSPVGSGLVGARAVVTGAGGGIGRAISAVLGRSGATVALVGRSPEALRETAAATPGQTVAVPTDITHDDDVDTLVDTVTDLFAGQLDVLVHCAGVYGRGALENTSTVEFDRMYEVNVRAPYELTRRLLPMLRKQRGHIVFVNSTQALAASEAVGQFAATQHALKALADSLRAEVNSDGLRVLSLFVGRTATDRQKKIFADEGKQYAPELLVQPTDIAQVMASCLLLAHTAEVTNLTIRPAIKSP